MGRRDRQNFVKVAPSPPMGGPTRPGRRRLMSFQPCLGWRDAFNVSQVAPAKARAGRKSWLPRPHRCRRRPGACLAARRLYVSPRARRSTIKMPNCHIKGNIGTKDNNNNKRARKGADESPAGVLALLRGNGPQVANRKSRAKAQTELGAGRHRAPLASREPAADY